MEQSLTTGTFAKLTAGGTPLKLARSIQAGTTVQAHLDRRDRDLRHRRRAAAPRRCAPPTTVVFTQLTTTGIAGDAGDVNSVTSDKGAVRGGSISANGNVNETGNGLFFDAIGPGANVTFDLARIGIQGRSSSAPPLGRSTGDRHQGRRPRVGADRQHERQPNERCNREGAAVVRQHECRQQRQSSGRRPDRRQHHPCGHYAAVAQYHRLAGAASPTW